MQLESPDAFIHPFAFSMTADDFGQTSVTLSTDADSFVLYHFQGFRWQVLSLFLSLSISLSSFLTRGNSIVNLAPLELSRLSSSDVNISSSVDEKQRQPTLENIYYI